MDTNQKQCELTDYALELIHHKARQLVGTAGYTQQDVEDIEQDLILDLLERLPKFDPAKAQHNTFVARIVERKISNLIRDRQAEVRDYRREACSLNEEIDVGAEELKQRVTTISQDELDRRTGKYSRPSDERAQLQIDLDSVIAELPEDLRRAAALLRDHPVSQVAEQMGIPHATFYDNHLRRLREAFEAKGLRDYLS